jgi:hypothetical protein
MPIDGKQRQNNTVEYMLRRLWARIPTLLGFAAFFLIAGQALAHERWILSPDQIAEWNAHPRPKLYSELSPLNVARNQAKIAALTRAKHQTVRPEAHRLTVAIGCPVMDLERDQRKLRHERLLVRLFRHHPLRLSNEAADLQLSLAAGPKSRVHFSDKSVHGVGFHAWTKPPRAYRLKASNAAPPISTMTGTSRLHSARTLRDRRHFQRKLL